MTMDLDSVFDVYLYQRRLLRAKGELSIYSISFEPQTQKIDLVKKDSYILLR